MTDSQIQRDLKVEKLCDQILSLITEDTFDDVGGRGHVKGWLDAIYSAGRIDGRQTALDEIPLRPEAGQVWRNRQAHSSTVVVLMVTERGIVTYAHDNCSCTNDWHAASNHQSQSSVRQFIELYEPVEQHDRLIEGWQCVVDSVTADDAPVIAYTVGSMWLCLVCGPQALAAEPVTRQHLLREQTYMCDQCDKIIVDSA